MVTGVAYGPLENVMGPLKSTVHVSIKIYIYIFYQTMALDPPSRDVWYYIGWRLIFYKEGKIPVTTVLLNTFKCRAQRTSFTRKYLPWPDVCYRTIRWNIPTCSPKLVSFSSHCTDYLYFRFIYFSF